MMTTTVRVLLPHLRRLIYLPSSATLTEAVTLMEVDNIARVPVIDGGGRNLRGIVRRKTLFQDLRQGQFDGGQTLGSFIGPGNDLIEIDVNASIFFAMERIREVDELLVKQEGTYTHIITTRGVANWWASYAEPFLVVEQLEAALRSLLEPFEGPPLEKICGRAACLDLNPQDYRLCVGELWDETPLAGLDRAQFLRRLQLFAEFRNRLMHFRLDSGTEPLADELRRLHGLRDAIQRRL